MEGFIMKVFFTIVILFLFISCNPILDAVTKKVELWICLGPTMHSMISVPTNKIYVDTLDKYFNTEGDKYKFRLDVLRVSQSGNVVTVFVIFRGIKYQETFYIYNKDIPYIYKKDVLIYLKLDKVW
jgi:hypothetical protein